MKNGEREELFKELRKKGYLSPEKEVNTHSIEQRVNLELEQLNEELSDKQQRLAKVLVRLWNGLEDAS